MPIYGYRCGSCGHEFEVLQKMSDLPLQTCPKCAGKLSKKIYAAGIVYKGSGYYSTDYKGGGRSAEKTADKSGSNGAGGGSSGSEGSGESKSSADSKSESTESKSESKSESTTSKSDSSTEKAS
jgi:putative FmdB family regulatory protein